MRASFAFDGTVCLLESDFGILAWNFFNHRATRASISSFGTRLNLNHRQPTVVLPLPMVLLLLLLLLLLVLLLVLLLLLLLLLVVLQPCLAVFGGRSDRQMRVRAQPVTNLQHVAYQLIAVTICGHHFINYGDNLSAVIAPWLIGRQVSLG